jgi:hypothetical protein
VTKNKMTLASIDECGVVTEIEPGGEVGSNFLYVMVPSALPREDVEKVVASVAAGFGGCDIYTITDGPQSEEEFADWYSFQDCGKGVVFCPTKGGDISKVTFDVIMSAVDSGLPVWCVDINWSIVPLGEVRPRILPEPTELRFATVEVV